MTNITTYIIVIAILIAFSAYFSATETAFSSLNKTRLKTMAEKGNKKASLAVKLSDNYDKLISTILIGNNIVNIATASIGTLLFVEIYGNLGATISTVVITIVVLIFGEISPKSIAKDCPERFAMFSSPFIRILIIILTPVNFLFSQWKKLLSKIFKLETNNKMSQDELLMLVEEVQQSGSIDKNEGELLKNAIEFTDLEAEDILTHRTELAAIASTASKESIAELFASSKFSRILVYDNTIDNVVGVIHQKDFYTGSGITEKSIKEIITPTIFVLKNAKIGSLLRQLQKHKTHVAVVLDEYSGTYGIVTMEDILEELVGEIWDEHDDVIEKYQVINSDTIRIDCAMDLDDFCELLDIKNESDMVSLSGWIAEQLGHVPVVGDSFQYGDMTITVKETDNRRTTSIDVTAPNLSNR
jgi:putative hemolysin